MASLLLFLFHSLLCLSVYALPPGLEERGGSGGISQDLLSRFQFIEQYAAAAYCQENHTPGSGNSISCGNANNCPLVQSASATSVLEFQHLGPADCTGFIAVDKKNKLIVLSFRGSQSLGNWIGNFNLQQVSWESCCKGCSVHSGFLQSWSASKGVIIPALKQAIAQNPGFQALATGHSLGGAIATLAVAEMRQQGISIAMYTFGSPMVGNDNFASFVTGQQGGNYRVTHAADIVPKLPGYFLGYRHVSSEYWLTSGGNSGTSATQVQVSSGNMDFAGSCGCILGDFNLKKRDLPEEHASQYLEFPSKA